MARLDRGRQRRSEVREQLIAWREHLLELYGEVGTWPGCPWPQELAQLRAGEPLEVPGYEVGHPATRVVVDGDGHVHPAPPLPAPAADPPATTTGRSSQ